METYELTFDLIDLGLYCLSKKANQDSLIRIFKGVKNMFTALFTIIGLVWVIVENLKKEPSNAYKGFVAFCDTPEAEKMARNYNQMRYNKRYRKSQKRLQKRQNRHIRNTIIASHCIKEVNKFAFGGKKRRF
jgi:FPC/CPF motif-containing protein YcgG